MNTFEAPPELRYSQVLATWTGAIAVVLGLFLAAEYGVLASGHYAIAPQSSEQWAKGWKCPADELEEENVSVAECQAMAARVGAIMTARPDWFRPRRSQSGLQAF